MFRACSAVLAEVDRTISAILEDLAGRMSNVQHLLDIGCWDGTATGRYASILKCKAHGVEIFPGPAASAAEKEIDVSRLDLEATPFPWASGSMDIVIANQVFEHLKNIWLPMSEASRVLRLGGYLVISTPNLGSFHNRLLLSVGFQPTSIRTFGPHVRGFTLRDLVRLVQLGGGFAVERVVGVGFYPLPVRVAAPLARLWPNGSHTAVILARKQRETPDSPWLSYLHGQEAVGLQTRY